MIFVLTMLFTFVYDRKNENHWSLLIIRYSLLGIQTPLLAFTQVHFYTFILLYTTLNLKACKINYQKKYVTFLRGVGGGLQKNVHMTFLVDKIDM